MWPFGPLVWNEYSTNDALASEIKLNEFVTMTFMLKIAFSALVTTRCIVFCKYVLFSFHVWHVYSLYQDLSIGTINYELLTFFRTFYLLFINLNIALVGSFLTLSIWLVIKTDYTFQVLSSDQSDIYSVCVCDLWTAVLRASKYNVALHTKAFTQPNTEEGNFSQCDIQDFTHIINM